MRGASQKELSNAVLHPLSFFKRFFLTKVYCISFRSSRSAADGYPEWILQPSKAVKKYDRNCFFSPVQCMLSFNQGEEQPIVFTSKGKRLFFYRK
ncbi:unnamed protein product [Heligmosomoides polygyrus]|uniref:Uncharacterized protein n=1 Tax=Heligmosomoides polygyrus TaxID=6339 RepID=A0A183G9Z1_HELPZ|nr:unnamed protein product [Heligmosomoides polygyrus]